MNAEVLTVTLNPALDKTVEIDRFTPGELNKILSARTDPGGKGINVAKALKGFGVSVKATGIVAGAPGRKLLGYVHDLDIDCDFFHIDGRTRENLKVFESSSSTVTELNETGPYVSRQDITRFDAMMDDLMESADLMVLSGSVPPGTPKDIYKRYIEAAYTKGITTILDADGELLAQGIKAKPVAIKPNIYELERLTNRTFQNDEEVVRAAKEIIANGVKLVVVSMGSEGSIVVGEKETYRVKPFPIRVQSTVGAGDAMVAGLVYAMMNDDDLAFTSKWITAAGTVTASKAGTQVCTRSEVEQNVDKVRIERI